ncbi:MAG: helix-turn-helix transcriptional regulator [Elusimicrobiota bacterium]|jgi:transcriptional regulator with XRE-family HTH domain|nr:helix-turn-helix transcriptional regulator [Elusimicrobiota bacterium]
MAEEGLTQKDLAKTLKVKQPQISRWVNGERNPSLESLKKS